MSTGDVSTLVAQQGSPHVLAPNAGRSIGRQSIALAGVVGFFIAWAFSNSTSVSTEWWFPVFFAFIAVPMAALTLVGQRTLFRPQKLRNAGAACQSRWAVKYFGLVVTLLLLMCWYAFSPIYRTAAYEPVWRFAGISIAAVLILGIPYFFWMDWLDGSDAEDGYWHAGLLILGRWKSVGWTQLRDHALGWAVKGFFLPLMAAGAVGHLEALRKYGVEFKTFEDLYVTSLNCILTIDVIFGAVGYALTLRLLNTHIRSTEKTLLGWISALCCYPPFVTLLWANSPLSYHGKTGWHEWLYDYPMLSITWALGILMLHCFYVWATCSFGCAFSNLTNRGIITDGPYRYVKHPAYLAKNLAWWMMYVPFVANGTLGKNCLACIGLLLTNFIYFVRAKTEERHLKSDPDYLAYCSWMEENGFGAWCKSRILSLTHTVKGNPINE